MYRANDDKIKFKKFRFIIWNYFRHFTHVKHLESLENNSVSYEI